MSKAPWRRLSTEFEHSDLEEFRIHLEKAGHAPQTILGCLSTVRAFLRFTGETDVSRISEDLTRRFFASRPKKAWRREASAINRFLTFAAARLPAVVDKRGPDVAPASAVRSKKAVALRERWSLDKAVEQKERDDDLIAKLARKVIDHFLYFQDRMKGEPENLDTVFRFAAECKELIETNLALFMRLSTQGHNIHSAIDERVQG